MNANIPDFKIEVVENAEGCIVQREQKIGRNFDRVETVAMAHMSATACGAKKPSGEHAPKFGPMLIAALRAIDKRAMDAGLSLLKIEQPLILEKQ
jgi:hypothetical protein